jgi:DNA-binding response OmpR family regulator
METETTKQRDKKILVVEDDPYTNELISNLLATRGFNVVSVGTGEEAVEYTKQQIPDLVVLDLLLPQIDGWEVCSILRKPGAKTTKVPILVTSVLSRFDTVQSDGDMANISFFSKPFESSDLVNEVERILEGPSRS